MATRNANVLTLQGGAKGSMELPAVFDEQVREDLIRRAVIAEQSQRLQPKGHDPLAGFNTTARYYGAMNSYRSGRHQGVAIRPRQKLGGGSQGAVRRIPSSVKGHRAHPHMIEKTLEERINKKEYQKAIRSSIAATGMQQYVKRRHGLDAVHLPIVLVNEIESAKKTKDILVIFEALKLSSDLGKSKDPKLREGKSRVSKRRHFRKSVLLIVNEDKGAVRAARNIPGVDACALKDLTAELLAPGGQPGRIAVWSENAIKNVADQVSKFSL